MGIDLDDEEEIDDDEPQKTVQHSANKKGIEIFYTAPSKMASEYDIKDPLEHKQLSKSSNGEPNEKKIKLSELLDDSAEGVEQVEEIDDDEMSKILVVIDLKRSNKNSVFSKMLCYRKAY